ncbi:MAG: DinB family protein [Candidatus Entotheonellia bacterium]
MDEALQLVIAMSERNWNRFKDELKDVTPEESNWRPLPQANNMHVILKHLWVEEQLYLASLEHGAQSPYQDTASLQRLTDAVPLEFTRTLEELEELHNRFLAALRNTTLADLKQQAVLAWAFAGGAPLPAEILQHWTAALLLRETLHLAMHQGQIRTIRNLYRTTRGEPGLFFPDNPTFPA